MSPFLKTHRLVLTPLSPIHIGCGEEFEPTNYVIDDGVLYGFDPSRAALTEHQKGKLRGLAEKADLLAIQRFFRDNASVFKPHADVLIPVSAGVAQQYQQRIGRAANDEASGNAVVSKLAIDRTGHTGVHRLPFIPGSSLKGCLRTAWLDALNGNSQPADVQFDRREKVGGTWEPRSKSALEVRSDEVWLNEDGVIQGEAGSVTDLETRLLKGDFATSPLRLFRPSDLMPPPNFEPARRVIYSINLKKQSTLGDGEEPRSGGVTSRKECILHGQYRAFAGDVTLHMLHSQVGTEGTPDPAMQLKDLRQIARQANAYHLARFRGEMQVLDQRGFVAPDWKSAVERLLNGPLKKRLDEGEAFLARLGRYGGAESKTLSGEGVASIKIMGGKGQPPTFQSATRTVWLAADHETQRRGLLPFGGAPVEIDPQTDEAELQAWCVQQAAGRPDMAGLRRGFEDERLAAESQKEAMRQEAAAREAAKAAETAAAAERAEVLAAMSGQAKEIEQLRQKCEELAARIIGGNFKKQPPEPAKAGLYQDANTLVKRALESPEWSAADKLALAEMLEQWLPQVIVAGDAKEQRKKLKLSALKSHS